jgi:hypothetical protein
VGIGGDSLAWMSRRCSLAWLCQASRSTQPAITTEITKLE